MKHKEKMPTKHERAPEVSKDVTPPLKGGNLEKKSRYKRRRKMIRAGILWLMGVPLIFVILLWYFFF